MSESLDVTEAAPSLTTTAQFAKKIWFLYAEPGALAMNGHGWEVFKKLPELPEFQELVRDVFFRFLQHYMNVSQALFTLNPELERALRSMLENRAVQIAGEVMPSNSPSYLIFELVGEIPQDYDPSRDSHSISVGNVTIADELGTRKIISDLERGLANILLEIEEYNRKIAALLEARRVQGAYNCRESERDKSRRGDLEYLRNGLDSRIEKIRTCIQTARQRGETVFSLDAMEWDFYTEEGAARFLLGAKAEENPSRLKWTIEMPVDWLEELPKNISNR
ncbi:MAG: hypothetical protein UT36_C0003G0002 [Candidatus Peregrinibacteria bacterium GW2011_GWF2_39_17]|nr:MAG: hypothetical protein UT36_C0003G0002 [Candidatus Peregrinibacteria bacterium GW2011_GWF2_39_17]HCW32033.1 hypothetical protein [Candidatus Peregrinibacteria bacterium]